MNNSGNEQLRALYEIHYENLKHELNDLMEKQDGGKPTNPLLISIDDEERYQASDIKIMFFGQETNDWENICGREIDHLLATYQDFLGATKKGSQSSHFWRMVRDYHKSVLDKNPGKKIDYIWNNILKVGLANKRGKPSSDIVKLQQEYFPVIKAEIDILKPDIVIFFTGPYYDEHIKHEFPDVDFMKISGMKEREICEIHSSSLPTRAFRTYHPDHLVWGKKALFEALKEL